MRKDTESEAHPVDVYVGARIRFFRTQKRLSQGELAEKIGVSFQAVQKYETGDIRISASRLYDIAAALNVPPGVFFEDFPGAGSLSAEHAAQRASEPDPFDRREIMALIRGYYGIRDPRLKSDILRLVTRLGNQADEQAEDGAQAADESAKAD